MNEDISIDMERAVTAIRDCLNDTQGVIGLSEPYFNGNEWRYVQECLNSGWVSSAGKFVDRFEADLAAYTGAGYAVATVNGTAALHIALQVAGVKPGDEVLAPTLSFVATTNAIAYCCAIPHFVDSEWRSLGVNPEVLRDYLSRIGTPQGDTLINRHSGRPIRALVVMHTLGHPVDLDPVVALCEEFGISLVEDAAEALGSQYRGHHVGHAGQLGILSFNGNKIVTTGGGGAILTDDEELARQAKHLSTTAKLSHPWRFDHDRVGYNYRLPNINAALGCAQLEQLPAFVTAKRQLADRYRAAFNSIDTVSFVEEPDYGRSNYWLHAIRLHDYAQRDLWLEHFHSSGIQVRPIWTLQNELPMFRDTPAMPLPVAKQIEQSLITLPSSVGLVINDA